MEIINYFAELAGSLPKLLNQIPGAAAQGLIWGIMAIGVYITYRILDVADLTVDGSIATGGAVAAMLIINGWSFWSAMCVAFLFGMLAGLVTGIFHTSMGIPAILSGILTQLALYSINLRIMLGKANTAVSVNKYEMLVSSRYVRELSLENPMFPLIIITVLLVIVMYWFFGTEYGSSLRATGSNQAMSRAQGINTESNKVFGLMLSNGIVSFSGALLTQYQGYADVNMGRGAIVIGLAAVIIGEVVFGKLKPMRGIAGKLLAVSMGAIIYYLVIQVVIWMGLNTNDLKMLTALVVAMFLAFPHWKAKLAARKAAKEGGSVRA
ncbi:MAG: ABC transporter permease [Clostridia bacterium]|nr:ABC transporter permease [Clostridia bacterium]